MRSKHVHFCYIKFPFSAALNDIGQFAGRHLRIKIDSPYPKPILVKEKFFPLPGLADSFVQGLTLDTDGLFCCIFVLRYAE
jgi:hypothetical protein